MKIEDCKDNRYFSNVRKLQRADDETIMHWVNAIAETYPNVLKQIEEFYEETVGNSRRLSRLVRLVLF